MPHGEHDASASKSVFARARRPTRRAWHGDCASRPQTVRRPRSRRAPQPAERQLQTSPARSRRDVLRVHLFMPVKSLRSAGRRRLHEPVETRSGRLEDGAVGEHLLGLLPTVRPSAPCDPARGTRPETNTNPPATMACSTVRPETGGCCPCERRSCPYQLPPVGGDPQACANAAPRLKMASRTYPGRPPGGGRATSSGNGGELSRSLDHVRRQPADMRRRST
jgi:hypothetical protein